MKRVDALAAGFDSENAVSFFANVLNKSLLRVVWRPRSSCSKDVCSQHVFIKNVISNL